jgi:hydrophobic/amphiphilic exporter-1 (mainly G- bacteria), HAE1 family
MALSSPTLPFYTVDEYAQTFLAQRISTISGVAQVSVFGSQKYAVRVQVDPRAMAARGIGIDEVEAAVARANVNKPTGTLYGAHQAVNVQATGQLTDAAAYRPLVVAYRNGSPVRLGEIGRVVDGVQTDKVAGWFNDERAVVLAVQRQPGTNTIEIVDAIRKLLPTFRQQLPAAVNLNVVYDRSVAIRESVHDVQFTLMLTIGLVVMVIFLFLRNVSATIIPSLAVPLSIIGTFAIMYMLGYTVDIISLMALTLCVGFVVDDAVVMLENIVRHMEAGESRREAALKGAREIGFTIMSMTLSLAAVFIPVLFMGGVVGRLLHEFAITIMAAVLVSGLVSLTLTPMMCSRFLQPPHGGHNRLYQISERFFDGMLRMYDWTLQWALGHRVTILVTLLLTFVATAWGFYVIPKGFIPTEDNGAIFAFTEAAQDISFEAMAERQRAVVEVVLKNPHIQQLVSFIGASGSSSVLNNGRWFALLKPRDQRPHAEQIIQDLRPKLAAVPGIRVYPQIIPTIRLGGQLTKAVYQYTLQAPDTAELYQWAPILFDRMRTLPGLQDVNTDLQISSPQITVDIDRDQAAAREVTVDQIESALGAAYGSKQVSTIYTPSNQYWVILEVDPEYQRDATALERLYLRSAKGALVPLASVAKLTPGVGPLTVTHLGQLPAVTISFNTKAGVSLSDAVRQVETVQRELRVPATVSATFQGTAQAFQASLQGQGLLLLVTILVIYLILGVLYESFIHPLTILSGLPSAGVGALATLLLFRMELNVYGFVGLIMLVGIVKKNAIMMIDFAIDRRRVGMGAQSAIREAALLRFRPIMMTTFAAIFGTLPIAIGAGAGAELRQPLGIAVVGGLCVSQLLTLFITPVIYIYLDRIDRRLKRRLEPQLGEGGEERPHVVAAE